MGIYQTRLGIIISDWVLVCIANWGLIGQTGDLYATLGIYKSDWGFIYYTGDYKSDWKVYARLIISQIGDFYVRLGIYKSDWGLMSNENLCQT